MGFFWEEGRDPSWNQISNLDRGQQRLLRNDIRQAGQLQKGGYGDAMSLLQQYLNPQSGVYQNFEKPYLQEFEQKTVPGLAEKFAGLGAMGGGLSSSGFGQSLGAAGANLQTQLAQMKDQFRRQSINDLLGQYNQLTNRGLGTKSFENVYDPGTQGQLGFGGKLLDAGLTAAATAFGGPAGGALYSGLSGMFKNGNNSSNQGTFGSGNQGSFSNLDINFGQRY